MADDNHSWTVALSTSVLLVNRTAVDFFMIHCIYQDLKLLSLYLKILISVLTRILAFLIQKHKTGVENVVVLCKFYLFIRSFYYDAFHDLIETSSGSFSIKISWFILWGLVCLVGGVFLFVRLFFKFLLTICQLKGFLLALLRHFPRLLSILSIRQKIHQLCFLFAQMSFCAVSKMLL